MNMMIEEDYEEDDKEVESVNTIGTRRTSMIELDGHGSDYFLSA